MARAEAYDAARWEDDNTRDTDLLSPFPPESPQGEVPPLLTESGDTADGKIPLLSDENGDGNFLPSV